MFDCRFLRYNPEYPNKNAIKDILGGLSVCPRNNLEILDHLAREGDHHSVMLADGLFQHRKVIVDVCSEGVDAALSGLAWFVEQWGLPSDKRFYDIVLTACRDHHECEKVSHILMFGK